jgi:hypothetical protein
VWGVLRLAGRAAAWRTTPDPPLVGLVILLAFAAAVAIERIALELLTAGSWHGFNPYGLNAVVAWIALELAVAALFVRPAARASALSAMFTLSILADFVTAGIRLGAAQFPATEVISALENSPIAAGGVFTIAVAWWIGAMSRVIVSLQPQSQIHVIGRTAALWIALFVVNAVVPHAPVFLPPNFDPRSSNWWEVLYALHQEKDADTARASVGQIETAQQALLQKQFVGLAPQQKGVTDVYALGIAGMDQDVFGKELDGGLDAIGNLLPIKNRTIRLINRHDTVDTIPLATVQNFAAAVHAIGNVMDKSEDVFVLFMTSHGIQSGFALQLPGTTTELTPQQLASTLDKEGIKNRVVIISACFSGIFLPPLVNDNSIVITAADAKSTSFGCAPERDWTYFGDAFFRQSLHPGSDFASAFAHARILIEGWELMDRLSPSNPQGSFGPAVVEKLAPYFATNPRP